MAAPGIYVPSYVSWTPEEVVAAPVLRSQVSGAIQVLSRPPMFIGAQTQASQSLGPSAFTPVQLDTEITDSVNGHLLTTSQGTYYAMFPGWYLADGTAALNYTGGTSPFSVGITASQDGGVSTEMGMTLPSASGFVPVVQCCRLVQMVQTGNFGSPSNDFIQLTAVQGNVSSQSLLNGAARQPRLEVTWVSALAGTAPLPAPANAAFPQVSTTLTAAAPAGSTTLNVASAAGMTYYGGSGGTIGLDIGTDPDVFGITRNAEAVIIAGPPSGLTIPVTPTLYAHGSGATVSVPVSAPFMDQNVRDEIAFLTYPPIMEYSYFGTGQMLASQGGVPGTGATIQLFSPSVDNYSAYTGATGTWTAPVAGTYTAYGQVAFNGAAGANSAAAGLTVTSANYNGGTAVTLWGGTVQVQAGIFLPNVVTVRRNRLRLSAGDTIQLAGFYNDSGAASAALLGDNQHSCRLITVWRGAAVASGTLDPPGIPQFPAGFGPQQADMTGWVTDSLGFQSTGVVFRNQATTGQSFPTGGTSYVVAFAATPLEDPYGGWNHSSNSWLAPFTGYLEIEAFVSLSTAASSSNMQVSVLVSGTTAYTGTQAESYSATSGGGSALFRVPVVGGQDFIQVQATVSQNSQSTDTSSSGRRPEVSISYISQ